MKVRIEFNATDGSIESSFDLVEFSTCNAEDIDTWAEVIVQVAKLSNWQAMAVVAKAAVFLADSNQKCGPNAMENLKEAVRLSQST